METDSASADIPAEDVIKILVATDIHLGHKENDPVRGEDSFLAFEEVLAAAAEGGADLVLLGGDLFDHAKPSPNCMLRCTQLIRKYCFGDKPIAVELLSDQLRNFSRSVNYEDPNLNVSLPILSIHGNHDDPVGADCVSSLDILSSMGLVNYFGKWSDYTAVRVSPVLLAKGTTRLALYGLSHLKDQRLSRLFKEGKVEMEKPDGDDWFNLLVLHQNRADRGPGNYIPEDVLPDFLDLVVWGHEHDCRVHEEENLARKFFVTQPGSTVATSLAAGEAIPKHCAMLQIHKKKFILTPVPLKTVRPFIFKTIVISEENLGEASVNENEKVQEFLKSKVYEAIEEAERLRSGDTRQPSLPLVRLSVFFEHQGQDFNRVRFGQNFSGVVANANDILVMKREKRIREKKDVTENEVEEEALKGAAEAVDVESLLCSYFAALPGDRGLTVLNAQALTEALTDFTIKKNDEVFRTVFDAHKRRCIDELMQSNAETEREVDDKLRECKLALDEARPEQLKDMLRAAGAAELAARRRQQQQPRVVVPRVEMPRKDVVVLSSDDEEARPEPAKGRGRGRGARGARGGRARGRAAARSPSPPPTPERRTPRRTAAKRSASWLQNIMSDRSSGRNVDDSD